MTKIYTIVLVLCASSGFAQDWRIEEAYGDLWGVGPGGQRQKIREGNMNRSDRERREQQQQQMDQERQDFRESRALRKQQLDQEDQDFSDELYRERTRQNSRQPSYQPRQRIQSRSFDPYWMPPSKPSGRSAIHPAAGTRPPNNVSIPWGLIITVAGVGCFIGMIGGGLIISRKQGVK